MFGAILQVSGGVEVIADTLLKVFGEKKAPWALGITGLIVGMPVFFESGLLILIPVAFGIARKTNKSVFNYSIPLLAGLAIGHAFCTTDTRTGISCRDAWSRIKLCDHAWNCDRNSGNDFSRTGICQIYWRKNILPGTKVLFGK